MKKPLHVAIAGMGGYAGEHHEALRKLEALGDIRLVATCDLDPSRFAAEQEKWRFAERGVRVYTDFDAMLDAHGHELDFVTLPTPIPLHAPMHRACVERGLACYLEKPPTLCWRELEAMIGVEKNARHATQVGFNYIAEKPRQELKKRLLTGEFGALRRAGFLGNWPRPARYFQRASWAGRLMQGDRLVLDSCTGNAMAHFLHNLLFWCGQDAQFSWGKVQEMSAELLRAHDIESFDTAFARGTCGDGIEILLAATHIGDGPAFHREWLECDLATITYRTAIEYVVQWNDGRVERGATEQGTLLTENLRHYVRYLRGDEPRPLTLLSDARPFVHFHNLLFVAAKQIHTVAESHLRRTSTNGKELIALQGVSGAMEELARTGRLPGETGALWSQTGGHATVKNLPQLEPVVRAMKAGRTAEELKRSLLKSVLLPSSKTPSELLAA